MPLRYYLLVASNILEIDPKALAQSSTSPGNKKRKNICHTFYPVQIFLRRCFQLVFVFSKLFQTTKSEQKVKSSQSWLGLRQPLQGTNEYKKTDHPLC